MKKSLNNLKHSHQQLFEQDDDVTSSPTVMIGVDEVGRGALIGNVIVAAVILPERFDATLICDSKKLTEKKRELAAAYIKRIASYQTALASPAEVDALNIHHATLLAMKRAITQLLTATKHQVDVVMVDGKFVPNLYMPFKGLRCEPIIKGDSHYAAIAAASIIAKTTRDKEMYALHEKYPMYGFDKHKGYATKVHYAAIEKHGVLLEHRKTFKLYR